MFLARVSRSRVLAARLSRTRGGGGPEIFSDEAAKEQVLFGERPLKEGERRERASWELPYFLGMGGCLLYGFLMASTKQETSAKIWAREEALEKHIPNQRELVAISRLMAEKYADEE